MPNTTLGTVLSEGLKVIGEPEISALTATNILQLHLIEEINNTIAEIMELGEYEWTYKHATLTTTDDITTGSAAATNASTTVTSVDSDGDNAQNFTSVTNSMWFRLTSEQTSYGIASVDSTSDPNTLTLDTAFVGTTTTAGGYRCFQDTYSISTSDMDEIKIAAYGEGASWLDTIGGLPHDSQIRLVRLSQLYAAAGGDLHRDTSGKPRLMAQIGVDSSDNPQWILWPFPQDQYLINLWYTIRYSDLSTVSASLWGADAPPIAYAAVAHRVKKAACVWDKDYQQAQVWEERFQGALNLIRQRENGLEKERSMSVETYRRGGGSIYPVVSHQLFDTVRRR